MLSEFLIHFIWQNQYFDKSNLHCDGGEELKIISTGYRNNDAGPDFFEAKIKINDVLWSGQVEIHIKSTDWTAHNHHNDKNYDTVILHVVWENNSEVCRTDGTIIPVLSLKTRTNPEIFRKYEGFNNLYPIHCRESIRSLPALKINNMIDRAAIERLQSKADRISELLIATNNHWEISTLRFLLINLAFNKNKEQFELLSRSIPWLYWLKSTLFQKEALIFGQAGLLQSPQDEYSRALFKEYNFLKYKWKLSQSIKAHHWKYMRMRPSAFPDLRLAQFCSIVHHSDNNIFKHILHAPNGRELTKTFQQKPSEYWETHFRINISTEHRSASMGKSTAQKLIINFAVPLLFNFGKSRDNDLIIDKCLRLAEELPSEKNRLISEWENLDINAENCLQSQGLLQLYKLYCKRKACLQCNIGREILLNN